MAIDAPPQPRTDTPNDFREDVNEDVRTDPGDDANTQVVILVTPIPAPELEIPDEELDEDADLPPPPPPRIELRHLRIPKSALYEMIPDHLWTESAITATLGVPLKIARYMGSDENKTPNPSMIGFSMLCDFSNLGEFGKVIWTKVLGAVVVAKVDGSEMDVLEFTALIKYVNVLGEELRRMKVQVEEDMKVWDAEMRARIKAAREAGEEVVEIGKKERVAVKEAKRLEVVTGWARERASVEAFGRFRERLEMGLDDEEEELDGEKGDDGEDLGAVDYRVGEKRVDEVIEGLKDTTIV